MYVYILEAPVRMEHYKNIGHLRRITYDGSVGRSNLRRICCSGGPRQITGETPRRRLCPD